MKKIKVGRNSIIKIIKSKNNILENDFIETINYEKWVEFIEKYSECFVWYENTEGGKEVILNFDNIPDWAKEGAKYRLNKTTVYCTNKIVKNISDLVIRYFKDDGIVKIDIEKKMSIEIAKILLEMSIFLEGKLIIDNTKELENVEQLD